MPLRLLLISGYGKNEEIASVFEARGCAVTATEDEARALARLRAGEVDLILLGGRVDGCNGIEVGARVRKLDGAVPIVFFTAYPTLESATEALHLEFDAYLQVPCPFEDLVCSVQRVAFKRRLLAPARLRWHEELVAELHERRRVRALSLDELAEGSGLDRGRIEAIEGGRGALGREELEVWADALGSPELARAAEELDDLLRDPGLARDTS